MIIGLILLPVVWALTAGINKQHKEETGVNVPSRRAMQNIRRTARRKGISEQEAYSQWLARKQKAAAKSGHAVRTSTIPQLPPRLTVASAHPLMACPQEPPAASKRIRPPEHDPFDFEHLQMIASMYGWTVRKQAMGLYFIVGADKQFIENPYADDSAIKTDFTRQDVEDFLLTC